MSEACPFCRTAVHAEAIVCPGCHARKGYTEAQGSVYGREQTQWYGIRLPAILALVPLVPIALLTITGNAPLGALVAALLWAAFMAIPIVLSRRALARPPRWFRPN